MAAPTVLRPDTFRLFAELIYANSGITLRGEHNSMLARRLREILEKYNAETFEEFLQYVQYHPRRNEALFDLLDCATTHETYFYREEFQLQTWIVDAMPLIAGRLNSEGKKDLRVWSAACSTGEEPYSLAILLHEAGYDAQFQIRIVATDLSEKVLKKAREGLFSEKSFRTAPVHWKSKYFTREGNEYRIHDRFRRQVSFFRLNMLDGSRARALGEMDVVFCRNVLIYFDQGAKSAAAEVLYAQLAAGGYLFLGHAESLIHVSTPFVIRHFTLDMAYHKPTAGGSAQTS